MKLFFYVTDVCNWKINSQTINVCNWRVHRKYVMKVLNYTKEFLPEALCNRCPVHWETNSQRIKMCVCVII